MDTLLEWKTRIITFVEKNEPFVIPGAKFIMMLFASYLVYFNLGFTAKFHHILLPAIVSVVGAIVPIGMGVATLCIYILLNIYGLGLEVTMVTAVLLCLSYLLYFHFAPKKGYQLVLTPVLSFCHIPYVMPVAVGLMGIPVHIISVLMGTVCFYYLKGISENATVFVGSSSSASTSASNLNVALGLITGNKEMILVLMAYFLTAMVVYGIRRRAIRNAWRIAIYIGILTQVIIILAGKLVMGNTDGLIGLFVGSILSLGFCLVIEFFCFDLDYTRVERVQFEDDYYYYYVKAVPKVMVKAKEKKVTTFKTDDTIEETIESIKEPGKTENEKPSTDNGIDHVMVNNVDLDFIKSMSQDKEE